MSTTPKYVKKINELKEQGFRIYSKTNRFLTTGEEISRKEFVYKQGENEMSPFGGTKEVEIHSPQGEVYRGVSECSQKDLFCSRLGFSIAFGRAVQNLCAKALCSEDCGCNCLSSGDENVTSNN